jgi:hypothetical protein
MAAQAALAGIRFLYRHHWYQVVAAEVVLFQAVLGVLMWATAVAMVVLVATGPIH